MTICVCELDDHGRKLKLPHRNTCIDFARVSNFFNYFTGQHGIVLELAHRTVHYELLPSKFCRQIYLKCNQ